LILVQPHKWLFVDIQVILSIVGKLDFVVDDFIFFFEHGCPDEAGSF
jgi:hypothetical protein